MKLGKINQYATSDSAFFSSLLTLTKAPKTLYVAGRLPKQRVPSVAIIGTRQPSTYGKEVTYDQAFTLAKAGVVVISGLAHGIDAIAHRAALDAGGVTIAVVAHGLHRIYPAIHERLAREIIEKGGAIISEYPLGEEARRYHFLARNRLVSGLSDVVLVTEAADRSGTTSTVGFALEQNKDVFAIPGPITSLLSVGPNRLIQQGAHVALSAQDVLDVIAPDRGEERQIPMGYSELEQTIIDLIKIGIRDGEELLTRSGAEASEFLRTMTMMELNGAIRALGANKWTF